MEHTAFLDGIKKARFSYPSKTVQSLYRTCVRGNPQPGNTLQTFISTFRNSFACQRKLKHYLIKILIQGAAKSWHPPGPSSLVLKELFYQDITQPVLAAISDLYFNNFSSVAVAAQPTPLPNEICNVFWFDLVDD